MKIYNKIKKVFISDVIGRHCRYSRFDNTKGIVNFLQRLKATQVAVVGREYLIVPNKGETIQSAIQEAANTIPIYACNNCIDGFEGCEKACPFEQDIIESMVKTAEIFSTKEFVEKTRSFLKESIKWNGLKRAYFDSQIFKKLKSKEKSIALYNMLYKEMSDPCWGNSTNINNLLSAGATCIEEVLKQFAIINREMKAYSRIEVLSESEITFVKNEK